MSRNGKGYYSYTFKSEDGFRPYFCSFLPHPILDTRCAAASSLKHQKINKIKLRSAYFDGKYNSYSYPQTAVNKTTLPGNHVATRVGEFNIRNRGNYFREEGSKEKEKN